MNDRSKFDPARVVALADAFASPRPAGSPGEARALERMSVELGGAGLDVEPATVARRLASPTLIVALSVVPTILLLVATGAARDGRVGVWLACDTAALIGFMLPRRAYPGWMTVERPVPTVEARTGNGPSVAIVVRSATPQPYLARSWIRALLPLTIIWWGILQATVYPPFKVWAATLRLPFLGLSLLPLFLMFRLKPNRGGTGPGDNRLGLAMLAELARTWPKSARGRVAVRFVVQGGPLGASLAGASERDLTIELVDPGLGPTLFLAGTEADLALDAARDLWVPHARPDRAKGRDFEAASVVIAGDLSGDAPLDPAAIGRAAQLVVEVALRWARTASDR